MRGGETYPLEDSDEGRDPIDNIPAIAVHRFWARDATAVMTQIVILAPGGALNRFFQPPRCSTSSPATIGT
jgi:hypothetical protein